ncbi:MAG: putative rRNA maturation factor [Candidatus Cloacimonadota bacterium]|nr:putative rRNA maturation factor [Candidatus Cloacimonadota bacterium]
MNIRKTKLNIQNRTNFQVSAELLWPVWKVVQQQENLSEQEINIVICNDHQMQYYNRKYRGKNSSTDVLSFPMDIAEIPVLGDIVIDIEAADRQKGENSIKIELQRLFLHGLLHLLGYDHLSKQQEKIMKDKEIRYWEIIRKGDK